MSNDCGFMPVGHAMGDEGEPMIETSASNTTIHLEDGVRVFPCRCGKTHRGPYAAEDYAHHNCFHNGPIIWLEEDDKPESMVKCADWDVMCLDCGKVFTLANPFLGKRVSQ